MGEFLRAYIGNRAMCPVPSFYFGFCETQTEATWILSSNQELIEAKLMDGTIQLPGGNALKKEMPADMLELQQHGRRWR